MQQKPSFINNYNELRVLAEYFLRAELGFFTQKSILDDCIHYAVESPGKRVRPVLAIAAATALGVSNEQIRPWAVAVELLHAASLIHDDLPALDNDQTRRGLPTSHVVFGEAFALLAGDALIGRAFQVIAEASELSDKQKVALTLLLAETNEKLCHGQALEKKFLSEQQVSFEQTCEVLLECHKAKTGALITASVVGALECIEENTQKKAAKQLFLHYGEALGLLFQITDDVLDFEPHAEGGVGGEQGVNSLNFADIYGREVAMRKAIQAAETAKSSIKGFSGDTAFLEAFVDYVLERTV